MKKILIVMFVLLFLVGCVGIEVTKTPGEEQLESPSQTEQEEETPPPEPPPQTEETPEETAPIEEEPEEETQVEEPPEEEPEEQTPDPLEVKIEKGKFDPAELTIKVGETVTWINLYESPIMVSGSKRIFNTKIYGGESHSYTFEEPGEYAIIKVVDPIFFGKVFVVEE